MNEQEVEIEPEDPFEDLVADFSFLYNAISRRGNVTVWQSLCYFLIVVSVRLLCCSKTLIFTDVVSVYDSCFVGVIYE